MVLRPPSSTLFPTRRSSDLAVAEVPLDGADLSKLRFVGTGASTCPPEIERRFLSAWGGDAIRQVYGMTEYSGAITQVPHEDRKSTRLNSSHRCISYAVFCLK